MSPAESALRWLVAFIGGDEVPDVDEIRERVDAQTLQRLSAEQMQAEFREAAQQLAPLELVDLDVETSGRATALLRSGKAPGLFQLSCCVEQENGLIRDLGFTSLPNVQGLDFQTLECAALSPRRLAQVHDLFTLCYDDANHTYLDSSLARLRWTVLAMDAERVRGFAIAETRTMDLPRLAQQTVGLAGLCCIAPELRRKGLMVWLEGHALRHNPPARISPRILTAGRMAHPASLRTMRGNASVVPRPGVRPTEWQRAVGTEIAAAYGSHAFDPETFVCLGDGHPIGRPALDVDVAEHEWELFAPVDRGRGDSLLAIGWGPDAPDGW